MSKDPLQSPKLKIERAKFHTRDLFDKLQRFAKSGAYRFDTEIETETNDQVTRLRILKPIPPEFSAIIGDAVQNLRAALDHTVCCLAVQADPEVDLKNISFPIAQDAQKFKEIRKRAIKKISAEAQEFIEGLKPYKGGNDALWELHLLGVIDRRRFIAPTWAATGPRGISMVPSKQALEKLRSRGVDVPYVYFTNVRCDPLEDNAVLYRAPPSLHGIIWSEFQLTITMAFGVGQDVKSEPIIPTLSKLGEEVEGITKSIEARFFS